MTQSELNQQIARRTGESLSDIARLGFTLQTDLPQDSDDEWKLPDDAVAETAST